MTELGSVERAAWVEYEQQYKRTQWWFWILTGYVGLAMGNSFASWIRDSWMPVWASAIQIIVNLLLLIMYLMSSLKLARKRAKWRELFHGGY